MIKEKEGLKRQSSKKGLKKNQYACSMEGVFLVSDPSASQYLKVAGQARKIKLQQV